ncbi:uncharacterized protein [Hoplias malabaricus]|uniref:uncharacterized protein n=1 Tax=Hoplias malabaricus TaxID=27720 RepID=UPI0034628267
MAVKIVLILLLFSVSLGHAEKTVDLKCRPVVGVIGENTTIPCSFKIPTGYEDAIIYEAMIKKEGQRDPLLYINKTASVVQGDTRVKLPSRTDPSLLFTNTNVSDEGVYLYDLQTSRGEIRDRRFRLSVTEYHQPVFASCSLKFCRTELYCNASVIYPAGNIHWFDDTDTNWTEEAKLEKTMAGDKLISMFSTLTFTCFSSRPEVFRCVVLDGSFSAVEEASVDLPNACDPDSCPLPALILCGVLVLVLVLVPVLILILIIICLYRNKCKKE